jgi:hypothetical protein
MKMNMVNGWNDTDRGKSKYLYNNRATWSTINLTQTVHSEGPATICRAVAQLFFNFILKLISNQNKTYPIS